MTLRDAFAARVHAALEEARLHARDASFAKMIASGLSTEDAEALLREIDNINDDVQRDAQTEAMRIADAAVAGE